MGEKEYNTLMSMLTFVKIQNDIIIQLIVDDKKYKKSAYKNIYKDMIKYWEETINED